MDVLLRLYVWKLLPSDPVCPEVVEDALEAHASAALDQANGVRQKGRPEFFQCSVEII